MLKGAISRLVPTRTKDLISHVFIEHNERYDHRFYDSASTSAESAALMANSIVERFQPKSVIDVGCGTGALLESFRALGCEISGLDYADAALAYCAERGLPMRKFDIERDQPLPAKCYDMAVSFGVAERLPPWSARKFVSTMCSFADTIVVSAAPPGQPGHHHINPKPRPYWINKFTSAGYRYYAKLSEALATEWENDEVVPTYARNVMVFISTRR
jgi:SAM-dependent methyltransferase